MANQAWILVGMMGSGKSTIGRELARATGRSFIDTDAILQQRLGRSVNQLFKVYGEKAFRDHETSVLKGIEPGEFVISTGGGIVLKPENWAEMRRIGATIFLDVAEDVLSERLERGRWRRPLLQAPDWAEKLKKMMDSRRPLYELADVVVKLKGEGPEESARQILQAMGAL